MQEPSQSERKSLVSVCMPTYNRAALLRQALDSVLAQTFSDFEIIISDNASPDETEEAVRSYSDSRIRYFRSATNRGHRENWQRCISRATGEFIAFLPDDDCMLPENLAHKVEMLQRNPNLGLVHSKYHVIDEQGRVTRKHTNWGHGPERIGDIMEDREKVLTAPHNLINVSSAVFRSECYRRLGPFSKRMRYAWDWEYLMRIAVYWDVYYLDEPLIQWRMHPGSMSISDMSSQISKIFENLAAKKSLCETDLPALKNGRELKRQIICNMAEFVAGQAERMLETDVPAGKVRAFLRQCYGIFPAVFQNRYLRTQFLKAVLGQQGTQVAKRVAYAFGKARS